MSQLNFPNITPNISLTVEDSKSLLLSSIAFQELALAHLTNAEAEKLEFALGTLTPSTNTLSPSTVNIAQLLSLNSSVRKTLEDVIKKEMLLEFQLEKVLELPVPPPSVNRIYVANGSENVSVIDGSSNTVTATVSVGTDSRGVAVNPTTNRIYVANSVSNNVSVIDGNSNTVTATVSVGSSPFGVAVNPATNRIYVSNRISNNVSVIDGSSNTVTATVSVGAGPRGVAVNVTTNRIYVTNFGTINVSVIDGSSNTVTATVSVGAGPEGVAVNP